MARSPRRAHLQRFNEFRERFNSRQSSLSRKQEPEKGCGGKIMKVSDLILLGKKIAVGIAVTLVPLIIITGVLWVGQQIVNQAPQPEVSHSVEAASAN
jgi:hypothetical protein